MPVTQVKSKQQFLVTDNVSFQDTYRITGLVNPVGAQDAATKAYVDSVKQALDIKDSARVATTGAETYTIVGGAVTLINGTTIDGVSIAIGDRILVKNAPAASGAGAGAGTANTTQPANGIYVVTGNTTNLSVSRSSDADVSADVTAGLFVFVAEGTANADNGYVLTTNDAITLNTTGLTFTQFSGAGQITAGAGLTKTGNTLDVVGTADRITVNADSVDIAATYAGQNTIVTLGTVTTGTWNATTIAATRGGTGLTTYVLGDILFASAANTLSTLAGNTAAAKRFLTQTGNGTISAAPTWGTITNADIQSAQALSKADDTNVTLTLSGTPATALLQAVTITAGWSGTLSIARGGTGQATAAAAFNALSPMSALGDIIYGGTSGAGTRLAGNTTTTRQFLSQTGTGSASAAPAWASIAGTDVTGAALTVSNDTNITLTLGGTPATSLLRAASITVAWAGTLGVDRGGTGRGTATAFMPLAGGTTTTGPHQSIAAGTTNGQALLFQGAGALPSFGAINLAGGANIVSGVLPVANGGTGQSSYVNGELLIGNTTGNTLTKATLTAGTGITITNGNGSITIASTAFASTNFVTREIPTGTINGINATFNLANTPLSGSEEVFVNGILQNVGTGNDYTITNNVITFLSGAIPQAGDSVLVNYRK